MILYQAPQTGPTQTSWKTTTAVIVKQVFFFPHLASYWLQKTWVFKAFDYNE